MYTYETTQASRSTEGNSRSAADAVPHLRTSLTLDRTAFMAKK
jgi:hypothetical protein